MDSSASPQPLPRPFGSPPGGSSEMPSYMRPTEGERNRRRVSMIPPPTVVGAKKTTEGAKAGKKVEPGSRVAPAVGMRSVPGQPVRPQAAIFPNNTSTASTTTSARAAHTPERARTPVASKGEGEVEALRAQLAAARREVKARAEEADRVKALYAALKQGSQAQVAALREQLASLEGEQSREPSPAEPVKSILSPSAAAAISLPASKTDPEVAASKVLESAQRCCAETDARIAQMAEILSRLQQWSAEETVN